MNLIQTALEQGWTIGELNKRIKEQSSLKATTLDRLQNRGDLSKKEVANCGNNQYCIEVFRARISPLIDATSHNLTKFTGRV